MGFVPAKCTQCGANIEVDETMEAGICKYCGTAFVTEKAINNYTINNSYNIQNANFVLPEKKIDNLRKLAHNEYKNEKYASADDYFKQILEINADDYECEYMRYLINVIETNQYRKNTFIEKLNMYITRLLEDESINFEDKKKELQDAFLFSEKTIVRIYGNDRDSCLTTDGKLIVQDGKSMGLHLNSICNRTYQTLFQVLDEMEKFLDSEYDVIQIWNMICRDINIVLHMRTSARLGTNGIKYYTTPSGAQQIYEVAKQLKEYASKTDANYKLSETLIPPKEGGKGIELARCYIATCVYGSYDCPQVWILRRFRDYTLNETWYGRLFIKCYYAISPTLVKWFGGTKWFRAFWKSKLDKMVNYLNNKGVEDTYYNDKY